MRAIKLRGWKFILWAVILLSSYKNIFAGETLVIQSKENKVFSEIFDGIRENSSFSVKRRIIPVDPQKKEKFLRDLKSFSGQLIFILGDEAFKEVQGLRLDLPLVFGGIVSTKDSLDDENICGVDFGYSPSAILNILKEAFPGLRTVGAIYNPKVNGNRVKEAKAIAASLNLDILDYPAQTASDVLKGIKELFGKIDVFWMFMDPLLANSSSFQLLLSFSANEQVPLFVLSESLVKAGGFLGIKDDFKSMGRKMADLAADILSGKRKPAEIGVHYPQPGGVVINISVGNRSGFAVSDEIIKRAAARY